MYLLLNIATAGLEISAYPLTNACMDLLGQVLQCNRGLITCSPDLESAIFIFSMS